MVVLLQVYWNTPSLPQDTGMAFRRGYLGSQERLRFGRIAGPEVISSGTRGTDGVG